MTLLANPAEEPANVAEATAVLDLATFPLIPGSESKAPRRLANLGYAAKGDTRSAYAFQKKVLEERGWQEAPNAYQSDQACSGSFTKDGYTVSLATNPSSGPDAAGLVDIHMTNHGNVDVGKLPVPPDAKPLYAFPTVAAYVTEKSAEETAEALRSLLTSQGWEPYGVAGDTSYFKKNAVKVSARATVAPAQGNKTVIQLSSELMSVDLPAPPDLIHAAYADTTKALTLEVGMKPEALVAFYKDALGQDGWKSTTEHPIKDGFREMLIYRNDAKDILTLKMHEADGKLRANLEQRTAAEFEEAIRIAQEEEAKRKAEAAEHTREATEKAAMDRVKIAVALPAGAKAVDHGQGHLKFKLAAGKASEAVQTIHAALVKEGWKGKAPKFDPMAGSVSLDRGPGVSVIIVYIDTRFGDAEVTISAFGSDIEAPRGK